MLQIRLADTHEIPFIRLLVHNAIDEVPQYSEAVKLAEMNTITEEVIQHAIDNKLCVVAIDNDTIVGVCFGECDGSMTWLSWIVVRFSQRRRHVGMQLMARFLRYAAQQSHKVWCSSLTDNIASNTLLQSSGFSQVVTLKKHWHGFDFHIWEKAL